jgi:hypothetical protein
MLEAIQKTSEGGNTSVMWVSGFYPSGLTNQSEPEHHEGWMVSGQNRYLLGLSSLGEHGSQLNSFL